MTYKKGFTLAEILITLTIVGIVAAITIPNLVGNASKKSQASLMRKTSVELTEAVDLEISQKDVKSVAPLFDTTDKINDFLVNTFKVIKNCHSDPFNTTTTCLPSKMGYISGAASTNLSDYITIADSSCIENSAGITICMSKFVPNATDKTTGYGEILVDTNGVKDPNIKGRDIFRLKYMYNGDIEDYGVADNCTGIAITTPDGCYARLEQDNWTMNY